MKTCKIVLKLKHEMRNFTSIKEQKVLSWKIVIITITNGVSQKKKTDQLIILQFQKQRRRKLNKYEVIKSVTKYLVLNFYKKIEESLDTIIFCFTHLEFKTLIPRHITPKQENVSIMSIIRGSEISTLNETLESRIDINTVSPAKSRIPVIHLMPIKFFCSFCLHQLDVS